MLELRAKNNRNFRSFNMRTNIEIIEFHIAVSSEREFSKVLHQSLSYFYFILHSKMDISFRVLAHCGMIVGEMGAIITVEGDE